MPYSKHECETHNKTTRVSLGFTAIPPKLVKGFLGSKPSYIKPSFTRISPLSFKGFLGQKKTYTTKLYRDPNKAGQGITTLGIYNNPTIIDQGIPWTFGIFLRTPHSIPKSSRNPKLNPHYSMAIQK